MKVTMKLKEGSEMIIEEESMQAPDPEGMESSARAFHDEHRTTSEEDNDDKERTKPVIVCLCMSAALITVVAIVLLGILLGGKKSEDSFLITTSGKSVYNGKSALIMTSVQDCFMPADASSTGRRGNLEVPGAGEIINPINQLRQQRGCFFDIVVRADDLHPYKHISFASTHGLPAFAHTPKTAGGLGKGGLPVFCHFSSESSCCPAYWINKESQDCNEVLCPIEANIPYATKQHTLNSRACEVCKENPELCFVSSQETWPDHCIKGNESSIPDTLYTEDTDFVIPKGNLDYVDGFGAFLDNTRRISTGLDEFLRENNVDTVYIMGITTEFGVLYTASHAKFLGYRTIVVQDASKGLSEENSQKAFEAMINDGIILTTVDELLDSSCPQESNVN